MTVPFYVSTNSEYVYWVEGCVIERGGYFEDNLIYSDLIGTNDEVVGLLLESSHVRFWEAGDVRVTFDLVVDRDFTLRRYYFTVLDGDTDELLLKLCRHDRYFATLGKPAHRHPPDDLDERIVTDELGFDEALDHLLSYAKETTK